MRGAPACVPLPWLTPCRRGAPRRRLCDTCLRAPACMVDDVPQRFCQAREQSASGADAAPGPSTPAVLFRAPSDARCRRVERRSAAASTRSTRSRAPSARARACWTCRTAGAASAPCRVPWAVTRPLRLRLRLRWWAAARVPAWALRAPRLQRSARPREAPPRPRGAALRKRPPRSCWPASRAPRPRPRRARRRSSASSPSCSRSSERASLACFAVLHCW